MTYVIKRTDQAGGYVACSGARFSYTKKLERAQIYLTREAADADRCPGNEIVLSVDALLGVGR